MGCRGAEVRILSPRPFRSSSPAPLRKSARSGAIFRAIISSFRAKALPMEAVLTGLSISISEFKKNPAKVLREAGKQPVAVLNHNKPAFYLVEPTLFEAMVEHLADIELAELAAGRIASGERSIRVKLEE